MVNKVEILMHPVRIKILQVLARYKDTGLTPLEMVKVIKDVPQATLYRHIQIMFDAGIIRVIREKKVKSVSEKYYALNETEASLNSEEWKKASDEMKLDYVSNYQLSLLTQYQSYLKKLKELDRQDDGSTFSLIELKIDDKQFAEFQNELNELVTKYYHSAHNETDAPVRTIAVTIIPDA
ncbi:transcriptional regulator [Paenibacillus sp. J45TS6]|uniref:helix-turn-helix domain-containing protein n=1 Tax=Paenibacillus sp. J45TS6 TaxID=2807196 RepID=UPI001B255D2D|nr:helix-turn-helix domain-containing protein [Paenibacillus sp. J45TS6]GIP45421.1 transcriptional regulator [Paenibacillus sp. J45TS6]